MPLKLLQNWGMIHLNETDHIFENVKGLIKDLFQIKELWVNNKLKLIKTLQLTRVQKATALRRMHYTMWKGMKKWLKKVSE